MGSSGAGAKAGTAGLDDGSKSSAGLERTAVMGSRPSAHWPQSASASTGPSALARAAKLRNSRTFPRQGRFSSD